MKWPLMMLVSLAFFAGCKTQSQPGGPSWFQTTVPAPATGAAVPGGLPVVTNPGITLPPPPSTPGATAPSGVLYSPPGGYGAPATGS